eukprot:CAMPEP_0182419850 /NCGR_PEP_ID=MMETSP1167-20130531/4208_1 /TAXON_ID=2988 /ORGANISM="Mallomonas Sp, Strain CCMP3275" /LENGTH=344 /DNA_ID=CAMNT_0024594983 /DNA_START=439 /DNA_END=1473 /DNA_ORIENTATION=-
MKASYLNSFTLNPSGHPSAKPSGQSTGEPSSQPTGYPSIIEDIQPVQPPTQYPSNSSLASVPPTGRPTGQPFLSSSTGPTGQSPVPTPSGLLGDSWWYFISFRCILWGEVPPSSSRRLLHILTVSRRAMDFVLRDRLGLEIVPPEALETANADPEGLWVSTSLPSEEADRVAAEDSPEGDDDTVGPVVGTVVLMRVWTSAADSLEEVLSVLYEIHRRPEILVGQLHVREMRSVVSVTVSITNSTTTMISPPLPIIVDVYKGASRIGWVIAGTIGVFIGSIFVMTCVRACCGKEGVLTKLFASSSRPQFNLRSVLGYKQFRSTIIRDLDTFRLDDDEVIIELNDM